MNIYDFKVKAQDGSEISLADYKGKVLLIVNTAIYRTPGTVRGVFGAGL